MKTNNDRKVFYGWNNLTKFELEGIEALKKYVTKERQVELPAGYDERDYLKFVQASFYDIKKAGDKIVEHFKWLAELPPEPRLTPMTIRLLQTGCFYIHGRDKFYRPTFVMDANLMAKLTKTNPEIITVEVFQEMFAFLFMYVKNVMMLPGQIEQWVCLCDLGNLSMASLPRKQIMAFGQVCQANLMFFMFKSVYVNVSWGQRLFYKAAKAFIDPET